MLGSIFVGILSGWLTKIFMQTHAGLFMTIIIGLLGDWVATKILGPSESFFARLIKALLGACILVAISRQIGS